MGGAANLGLCQSHNADPCMSRGDSNLLVSEKLRWQPALRQEDVEYHMVLGARAVTRAHPGVRARSEWM